MLPFDCAFKVSGAGGTVGVSIGQVYRTTTDAFQPANIFGEPTPELNRQFGSTGVATGGNNGPLNAELETENGADLLSTENGEAIATEQ